MTHLEPLMQRNFLEYASYVIIDRAIPDIRDGLKPVQRRILYTLFQADDGKFHKVANIIGETMKLHPHGDASIGEALVVLSNKEFFIDKQGNFGNLATGHSAAAPRYIECRLTALGKEALFNPNLTEYIPSYDGRRQEPLFLPVKVPVILMLGTEGIAVGMSTRILPHNFNELLSAQIQLLKGKKTKLYPDFPQGGIVDISEYNDGRGKVKIRATLEPVGDKKIIVREIPFSTTTESLIASIESAIQKGKVKISSINDFTTEHVEIELVLSRGTYASEVIPQLYAYTDCEISITSHVVVIENRHPVEMTIGQILASLTQRLTLTIEAELKYELKKLEDKQHALTLEKIFIEERLYKKIEKLESYEKIVQEIFKSMQFFSKVFIRPMLEEDVERLLDLKIRRISSYDIHRNEQDLQQIIKQIKQIKMRLKDLTGTVVDYLEDLQKKFSKDFPRRSKIEQFESVDRKSVARQNIKVVYDEASGFLGTEVKASCVPKQPQIEQHMQVSEYDLMLVINNQGMYRIMTAQGKTLVGQLLYWQMFNSEEGLHLTVVYRDAKKYLFAKRVRIEKFVRQREYALLPNEDCSLEILLPGPLEKNDSIEYLYSPGARKPVVAQRFALADLEESSLQAKGLKLCDRPVGKVKFLRKTK